MRELNSSLDEDGGLNVGRRFPLTGLAAAYAASFIPTANAQSAANREMDASSSVSKILTGRSSLDGEHAARLYDELTADSSQFRADVQALLAWIDQRGVTPNQLQSTLDSESSPMAALPHRIAMAWYTGIVGEEDRARCVTFETSLMHVHRDRSAEAAQLLLRPAWQLVGTAGLRRGTWLTNFRRTSSS